MKVRNTPRLEVNLTYGTTIGATLTGGGTWDVLSSANLETVRSVDFTNTSGSITFDNDTDTEVKFDGSAAFQVDQAARIEFMLFINDSPVNHIYSVADIATPSKIGGFSEHGFIDLSKDDVITVKAKSSVAGVVITVNSMSLRFFAV